MRQYEIKFSADANACPCGQCDEVDQTRVVSVLPPTEFIGNDENYLVMRKYETHAETWAILQVKGDPHHLIKDNELSFEARDGSWYCMWHDYHATNVQAADCLEQYDDMLGDMKEGHWKVEL